MTSRIDSIAAPRGAGRGPLGVVLIVASLVVAVLLIGLFEKGWLLALLVPVVAFSVFVCVNVLRILWAERSGARP